MDPESLCGAQLIRLRDQQVCQNRLFIDIFNLTYPSQVASNVSVFYRDSGGFIALRYEANRILTLGLIFLCNCL